MIQKLYNLKKTQTEQKLIEKSSLEQEVYKLDEEVGNLNHRINTATVEKLGSISDFMILAMHKDSLRFEVKKLLSKKNQLLKKIDDIFVEIIELQKESEQYKYILDEEREQKRKDALHFEILESEEFIQSKYIKGKS
ncbi:hypothetical protein [Aliarcobacter cryaerophilus]|uniref:hypothetical protein n=1 Tax=Aliarcobacter cryaerophilus TaxID=28198 RepID=UPI0011DFB096|nr:hypothetical protein [Aliarcobacter cryaerophilus]